MAAAEGDGGGGRPDGGVEAGGCGGSRGGDVGAAAPRRGTPPASAREQEAPRCGDNPSCSRCRTR